MYAYGEAVLGAETSPVVAYLCGLAVIQSLLMMAVFFALRRMAFVASPKLTATTRALAVFVGASGLWLSWAGNLGT